MNGFTCLSNEDFKKAILVETELEKAKQEIVQLSDDNLNLTNELNESKEELKDLILMLTGGKERASYCDYNFANYEIEDSGEIAKYLNENYLEKGVLKFKKIKKELEPTSQDSEV